MQFDCDTTTYTANTVQADAKVDARRRQPRISDVTVGRHHSHWLSLQDLSGVEGWGRAGTNADDITYGNSIRTNYIMTKKWFVRSIIIEYWM